MGAHALQLTIKKPKLRNDPSKNLQISTFGFRFFLFYFYRCLGHSSFFCVGVLGNTLQFAAIDCHHYPFKKQRREENNQTLKYICMYGCMYVYLPCKSQFN